MNIEPVEVVISSTHSIFSAEDRDVAPGNERFRVVASRGSPVAAVIIKVGERFIEAA